MTKKITALLLVTAVAAGAPAVMIACGGDDTTPNNPGTDAGNHDTGTTPDATSTNTSDSMPPPNDGGAGDADAAPPLPTGQVDRMGRPAINTALNYGDDVNKDKYNQEAAFQDWTKNTTYDTNFNNNLQTFDKLGGDQVDWPLNDAGVHPLRDPLKLDVLIVDTNVACTMANGFCESGYLDIESQLLLGGPPHTTCGGRTPAEDIIDKTLTLLVTKGRAPISDYVNSATKPPTHTFPYLADPN